MRNIEQFLTFFFFFNHKIRIIDTRSLKPTLYRGVHIRYRIKSQRSFSRKHPINFEITQCEWPGMKLIDN